MANSPEYRIGRDRSGSNVTIGNDFNVIYIVGDEFTDGSLRIDGAEPHEPLIHLEERLDEVWNLTGIQIAANTLHLGHDINLSALANTLLVHSVESDENFLIPETPIDATGTGSPRWTNAGARINRLVFQPDDSTDTVAVVHSVPVQLTGVQGFSFTVYVKVGAVPATSPVRVTVETGLIVGAGQIFWTHRFPTSLFAANTEVVLPEGAGIGIQPGDAFVLSITAEGDAFSLLGDPDGNPWIAVDFQPFIYEDIITLPTGIDRLLSDSDGSIVVDNIGNMIASGEAA